MAKSDDGGLAFCPDRPNLTAMSFDGVPTPEPAAGPRGGSVFFERRELDRILSLYGRMVAAGEWRDYAISGLSDRAVFAVYRRASEQPIYSIEKEPALARRQGAWSVIGQGGVILKRGQDLGQVLRVFESGRFKVVE